MKIGLFFGQITSDRLTGGMSEVFLFDIGEEGIASSDKKLVSSYDTDKLIIWLLSHRMGTLYVEDIDEKSKEMIEGAGIGVRSVEEVTKIPLLCSWLLSSTTGLTKLLLWCYFCSDNQERYLIAE